MRKIGMGQKQIEQDLFEKELELHLKSMGYSVYVLDVVDCAQQKVSKCNADIDSIFNVDSLFCTCFESR